MKSLFSLKVEEKVNFQWISVRKGLLSNSQEAQNILVLFKLNRFEFGFNANGG